MTRRRVVAAAVSVLAAAATVEGFRAAWIPAKAAVAQVLLERSWRRASAGEGACRPWPWADHVPAARLRAPRHGVDLVVLAGASGAVLAFAPGWVHGTAAPGADGNCVIAGHRDTQFAFLEDVRDGDGIELESADGRTTVYRVVETAVVHEHEVAVLSDDGVAELTLLTCWPFDTLEIRGPWRFMVRAAAIGSHTPANSSPVSSPECSRSGSNRR